MKSIIVALFVVAMMAGCATVPQDSAAKKDYYTRVCGGEIANAQGVALAAYPRVSSRDYAMHECLYRHGVRQ